MTVAPVRLAPVRSASRIRTPVSRTPRRSAPGSATNDQSPPVDPQRAQVALVEGAADQLAAGELGLEEVAPLERAADEGRVGVPGGVEPHVAELHSVEDRAPADRLGQVDVEERAPHEVPVDQLLAVPVLVAEGHVLGQLRHRARLVDAERRTTAGGPSGGGVPASRFGGVSVAGAPTRTRSASTRRGWRGSTSTSAGTSTTAGSPAGRSWSPAAARSRTPRRTGCATGRPARRSSRTPCGASTR